MHRLADHEQPAADLGALLVRCGLLSVIIEPADTSIPCACDMMPCAVADVWHGRGQVARVPVVVHTIHLIEAEGIAAACRPVAVADPAARGRAVGMHADPCSDRVRRVARWQSRRHARKRQHRVPVEGKAPRAPPVRQESDLSGVGGQPRPVGAKALHRRLGRVERVVQDRVSRDAVLCGRTRQRIASQHAQPTAQLSRVFHVTSFILLSRNLSVEVVAKPLFRTIHEPSHAA